ncbi:hypothetical protein ACI3LX_000401 [Candidozyma auris]
MGITKIYGLVSWNLLPVVNSHKFVRIIYQHFETNLRIDYVTHTSFVGVGCAIKLRSTMSPTPPSSAWAAVTSRYKPDNRGLISADRNNKATLPLTIPRCTSKSYAKDPSPPV